MASTVESTLIERGSRYGDFRDHARIAQTLKQYIRTELNILNQQLAPDQAESIEMICHKLARIINGDPNYHDSWLDIAGYATLVADRLAADPPTPSPSR